MAYIISKDCINCGVCVYPCPTHAIYGPGSMWSYEEGTRLKGNALSTEGEIINSEIKQKALSNKIFYIVPGKCTECKEYYDVPECIEACPLNNCIRPHPKHKETVANLLIKKKWLFQEIQE